MGGVVMPDYKEMYYTLLSEQDKVIRLLQAVHLKTEEMFSNSSMADRGHLHEIHDEKHDDYPGYHEQDKQ
jgi:hypothetical protein